MAADSTVDELAKLITVQAKAVSDAMVTERSTSAANTDARNVLSRERAKLETIKTAMALKLEAL